MHILPRSTTTTVLANEPINGVSEQKKKTRALNSVTREREKEVITDPSERNE